MRIIETIWKIFLVVTKFILCQILKIHRYSWNGWEKHEKNLTFNEKNKMIRGWNRYRNHSCSLCNDIKTIIEYRRIHSDWQNPSRLFERKAS